MTLGQVEVRDHVLWAKHIHGDQKLRQEILELDASAVIELKIDGHQGSWVKMNNGQGPTNGVRPVGATKDWWARVYREKRGKLVEIESAHVSRLEGSSDIAVTDQPAQLHPEASPGPRDSHRLFRRLAGMMGKEKRQG
jgi:hypothetical protein